MVEPVPGYRNQDRSHKRKRCKTCVEQGLVNKRPAPHPGPRCTTHHREFRALKRSTSWETRIKATYGITAEEYWRIYEHQGGRCYICRKGTGRRKKLSVDHCHETGVVRGLLDTACNRGLLGHLQDDIDALQRAIDYLKLPPAVQVLGERVVPDFFEEDT